MMQPRSKTAIWANDDAVPSAAKVAKKEAGITVKAAAMRVQENGIDEDVEYQDLSRLMPEKSSSLKQIPVSEPDQVQGMPTHAIPCCSMQLTSEVYDIIRPLPVNWSLQHLKKAVV